MHMLIRYKADYQMKSIEKISVMFAHFLDFKIY